MALLTKVSRAAPLAVLLLGAALISGCSREDTPSAGEKRAAARSKKSAPENPVNQDLVVAPTSARAPGLVQLKFAVTQKPEIGQPVDIELALIPVEGIEKMLATFQANEGLELRAGAKTPTYEKPAAGATVSHTLTIVPSRDGIFYVTAVVLAESTTDSVVRTFSIPVIAGQGLSATNPAANPATRPIANAPAANSRQSQ
jgi:hypothetical protein